MPLLLNDEQAMLRDSAQAFINDNAPVAHLRKLRDTKDALGYSPALWQRFGEQGFSATLVPEAHGGIGLGLVEAATLGEAMGHTLAPSPFLSTAVLAARALTLGGTGARAIDVLTRIAAAETIATLAIDESARHDPQRVETTAQPSGNGWRLDGRKTFVLDGHVAEWLIVSARTAGGVALFLLPAKSPGVTIERVHMLDAHNAARLQLVNVQVDADSRLSGDAELVDKVIDAGRVVVAAQLLGIADEVFTRTLGYLKERQQFERIIGTFQALQHRAAALYVDIEMTRAMVLKAAQAMDADPAHGTKTRVAVSAANGIACTTANLAVREGVQMHGGIGMTDEFDIGLFMKRERTLQELLGDATFHVDRVATLHGY